MSPIVTINLIHAKFKYVTVILLIGRFNERNSDRIQGKRWIFWFIYVLCLCNQTNEMTFP